MASFGAKLPVFAPFSGTEQEGALPSYGEAIELGKMITADLTVTNASGELYANDELAERVDEFASGQIALTTDDMVAEAEAVIYGHSIDADTNEVIRNAGDNAPYGGLAYYKKLLRNGVKIFKGYYYPKVKAAIGNDSAATRGSSITFGTTPTSFTVFQAKNGDWQKHQEFATESEAVTYVWKCLGKTN